MNVNKSTQLNFKGYDLIPLRGLYMQGIRKNGEADIYSEIKDIALKEGFDVFVNQECKKITKDLNKRASYDMRLSLWGQDYKSFVKNKKGKCILWNTKEQSMKNNRTGELSDYNICESSSLPRGGNYFLGFKENGEKWILINGSTITQEEYLGTSENKTTTRLIREFFDVKQENIFFLTDYESDLDEIIRPIGYPYILVNDYKLCLDNIEKMRKQFPDSEQLYDDLKNYIEKKNPLNVSKKVEPSCKELCDKLTYYGFKPIRIAGRFHDDINYMNAFAIQNNKNKISYITNSTKYSYPELEYLENLFEEDLRSKVSGISDVYFVSGGPFNLNLKPKFFDIVIEFGLKTRNVIMDILANRSGGIHCMCAEIPDFAKLEKTFKI